MRYYKWLAIGGMVFALGSPAWGATTIPFETAYNGPVSMHLSNWDAGTVYAPTGAAVFGQTYSVTDAAHVTVATPPKGPAGVGNEWGIVRIETIYDATMTGPNSMTIGNQTLYKYGDSGTELVGVFYGRQDDKIIFNSDGSQKVYSDPLGYFGDRINLYIQPVGTAVGWATGMAGPSASGAAGVYPGIGGAGSTLVLTGYVTPGFENGGADGASSTFTPEGASGEGTYGLYITWDGGTDLSRFGSPTSTGIFPFLGGPGAPLDADARLKGTITPTLTPSADPWLTSTSDPAFMNAIPEPATMAIMLLGLGCGSLRRFIRKHR